jgi:SAM-dependent methyltransferase
LVHKDAVRWDERYTLEGEQWLAKSPRQLLEAYAHMLPSNGLALDAACGVGVNALFLARRGLHVVALDISEVGLRLAKVQAQALGLPLSAAVYDLAHPWLPEEHFDVITNFHFLERATLPVFNRSLKPGGILLFETFVKTETSPDKPGYYLEPGELPAAYVGFEIIYQGRSRLLDDRDELVRLTEQLVARKPVPE